MTQAEPSPPAGRPRIAVVSLHAHRPMAPRGERTRRLVARLERDWEVELIAPDPTVATGGAAGSGRSSLARRIAARIVNLGLLDKWEPWSLRRFHGWEPDVDAALLIGHPYSPLVHASRRLRDAGIPYVVDVGDPWALTDSGQDYAGIALWRARRAERALWQGCAGAVLTTPGQAAALTQLFPSLPTLVRPAGYAEPGPATAPSEAEDGDGVLRLGHFGMLNNQRLDPRPLLAALARSGRWSQILLTQFGDDFVGFLDELPAGVEVEMRRALPWSEVVASAADFDLALVVGNVNRDQLPSKAVEYLTLPIPRLAIAAEGDALCSYVRDKPGWVTVAPDAPEADAAIADHLAIDWSGERLAPPPAEGWPAVADAIVEFIDERVS